MRIPVSRALVELAEQLRVKNEGQLSGSIYLVVRVSGTYEVKSAHLLRDTADKMADKIRESGAVVEVEELPMRECLEIFEVVNGIRDLPIRGWVTGLAEEDNYIDTSWNYEEL